MQNSQANTKKIFTKFFWGAGKVTNRRCTAVQIFLEVCCGVSLSPKRRSQRGTALQMGGVARYKLEVYRQYSSNTLYGLGLSWTVPIWETVIFGQIWTSFWQIPLLLTGQQSLGKIWTNLGFREFLDAVPKGPCRTKILRRSKFTMHSTLRIFWGYFLAITSRGKT